MMTQTGDKYKSAADKLDEHLEKVTDQGPWFIVRDTEIGEWGIYAKKYIIHDRTNAESLEESNEEYVTLMHPRVGELLRDHLLKMKGWIDAKFAMPSDVLLSAELLADELLRDIHEEPKDEIVEPTGN